MWQVGNPGYTPIANASVDEFTYTHDANAKGNLLFLCAVSKAISAQEPLICPGRHVLRSLGSMASYFTAPGMTAYVTGKHAVLGITQSASEPLIRLFALGD